MSEYRIYTISKMKGASREQWFKWRLEFSERLDYLANEKYKVIHPPVYYNYNMQGITEKEVKEFELNKLRTCDIAVVYLDGINDSVGSHFELGYIDAINSMGNKHIFVVGIGDDSEVHPWISESLFKRVDTVNDAAELIAHKLFA